jgi:stage II sporulation protein D
LKAQAIAARSFAILNRSDARKKGAAYDLENTALFQMYKGSGLVNDSIRKAVEQTRGEILTYHSSPIPAFFHSNCGGQTSRAADVWSKDIPCLQPASCPYGNNGGHFKWSAEISTADLARKLRAAGVRVSDVVQLEAVSRDGSNRILELSIMDGDGNRKHMKGTSFRMAVGPDLIRSTRFDADVKADKAVFNGKGWGHGVGLCQEGACGMALKGFNAFEILRHYYRGVMVEKMKNGD